MKEYKKDHYPPEVLAYRAEQRRLKKRRMAAYARVSTDHEEQRTSYEAQEESRSISENCT